MLYFHINHRQNLLRSYSQSVDESKTFTILDNLKYWFPKWTKWTRLWQNVDYEFFVVSMFSCARMLNLKQDEWNVNMTFAFDEWQVHMTFAPKLISFQ